MDVGVGLDTTLGLSLPQQAEAVREAARLGYTSAWTPETTGYDAYQVCVNRWEASRSAVPHGITTGIAVSPVLYRSPVAFAMSGGTASLLTGGKFIMGLGAGTAYRPAVRQSLGVANISSLALMRDYITTVKALVAGQTVNYEGQVVTLKNASLGIRPAPKTPVFLAALGPAMLRLAGELADGVCLNWCTPDQVAWSRGLLAEGAKRSGRDPAQVRVEQYVRVCVDDNENLARRAFAKSVMGYALGDHVPTAKERTLGYRAHFERMGFTEALLELDRMRTRGATTDQVADAFPAELLRRVGYFGKAEGAARVFSQIAKGLDIAVVRVVAARPGTPDSTLAVLRACEPKLLK